MNKREKVKKREMEREREYFRYTSYGHRQVVPLAVSSAGVPVEAGSCWCENVARSHGSAIGRDSWFMNIVNHHIGKLNLCYVTYIHNGRRERDRERESTLQDHVIHNQLRIALCLPDNSPVC